MFLVVVVVIIFLTVVLVVLVVLVVALREMTTLRGICGYGGTIRNVILEVVTLLCCEFEVVS